jgi:YegS/Rv2252/BmrU family lipid kinase
VSENAVPLFLNPAAGRGRAGKHANAIVDLFATCGVETRIVESRASGDLERQVFDLATSCNDPFLVAGGDGSVHEATNGLLSAGGVNPFGLVPIGTGNDFAKACTIPLDWQSAIRLLAGRMTDGVPPRVVDAGKMNDRYFANGVGIGFDAKINRIARKYRWPIGDLVYLVAVIEGLWDGVITPNVVMRYGTEEYRGRITLANISNGAWVGGMFYIAPMAEIDDGRLDLVFADPVSRPRILRLLPSLIRGAHIDEPDIHDHAIEAFELVAEEPIPCHLDGEVQPLQTTFNVRLLKGAMRIL